MKISYKWLQSYFEEKLPAPEKLAELITFGFAEVESVEKKGDDTILDVKVLPDRACYALSHRGVAYEVSAITGFPKKEMNWPQPKVAETRTLDVRVEAPELCSRYVARVIENITPKALPWVKEHLEAIGQRSINPIVDGANIVMFDMGQPLHAFDADKVEGAIVVRLARKGEKITMLDNREVILDERVLVIADDKSPLAIAGIKGGMKAAVTDATKNLILESANFDASYIRKTSERLGIKTDASKRFENKISPALAEVGMRDLTAFLFEADSSRHGLFGEIIDIHHSNILKNVRMMITPEYISRKLGVVIPEGEVERVLQRLDIDIEKRVDKWTLTPPAFRADLATPEDIAEEVGRIIGYEKIPATLPPNTTGELEIPKSFYYEWKIREALAAAGFSEVMTSSFMPHGDVEIAKPLAEDKRYARSELWWDFENSLVLNKSNSPLFGNSEVRQFEIGKVFPKSGEHLSLAIGCVSKKGAKQVVAAAVSEIERVLGVSLDGKMEGGQNVYECNLDTAFERLPEPKKWDISIPEAQAEKFKPFSLFPFIVRDVALFVPTDAKTEAVAKVIKENAGDLVVRGPELFDEFSKEGKKSLAFRLVFQSFERTLTDTEVNMAMEHVFTAVQERGWTTR